MTRPHLSLLVVLPLVVPSTATADVTRNGQRLNGQRLNGQRLNGQRLNGQRLNGQRLNGQRLNGVEMSADAALGTFELSGSLIVGSYADAPDSTCAHSELTSGGPLDPGCSACVDLVQSTVTWCGDEWHDWCVFASNVLCSFNSYDMIGVSMLSETESGEPVEIRIDSIRTAPDPTPQWAWKLHPGGGIEVVNTSDNENDDVLFYEVSGRVSGSDVWEPLCDFTDSDGNYNQALAVEGLWEDCQDEPGRNCGGRSGAAGFTFACRGGAMAKCVEIGYKPWERIRVKNSNQTCASLEGSGEHCYYAERWETLEEFHEACVRMVRADYCGNGVSHTRNGTRINVWDLNVWTAEEYVEAADASVPAWGFEAAWEPEGAMCISDERFNGADPSGYDGTIAEYIDENCSDRYDQLEHTSASCDMGHNWAVFDFERGAYIKNTSSALISIVDVPGMGEIDEREIGGWR